MEKSLDIESVDCRIAKIMSDLHVRYIRPTEERYFPTEHDLAAFEQRLKRILPIHYRRFLLRFGITAFDNMVRFRTPKAPGGDEDRLWVFYGYSPSDLHYHIGNRWESSRRDIPEWFLPIACTDGSGAEVYISLAEEDYGSLFYIDRETRWDYEEAAADRGAGFLEFATRIESSFMEFLEHLQGESPVNRACSWGSVDELRQLLIDGHSADLPDSLGYFACEGVIFSSMGLEKLKLLVAFLAPEKLSIVQAADPTDINALRKVHQAGTDMNTRAAAIRLNGIAAVHRDVLNKLVGYLSALAERRADPRSQYAHDAPEVDRSGEKTA